MRLRFFLWGALVGTILFVGTGQVGRAMDHEAEQRVIFTKDGVTLDCARRFGGHGSVSYNDCVQVP